MRFCPFPPFAETPFLFPSFFLAGFLPLTQEGRGIPASETFQQK